MPILYSLVARGTVVLADYTDGNSTNIQSIVKKLLESIAADSSVTKKTYEFER